MRTRLMNFKSLTTVTALAAGLAIAAAPVAHAQPLYLVGAELYSATQTGASGNTGYIYDTNSAKSSTFASSLSLNGTTYANKGIEIQLAQGANNFTINTSPSGIADPENYAGIGLFFSTTPTSYNLASGVTARTPDLIFASSVGTGTTGDFFVAAGTAVESYSRNATVAANGLTFYSSGGTPETLSNFAVTPRRWDRSLSPTPLRPRSWMHCRCSALARCRSSASSAPLAAARTASLMVPWAPMV